MPEFPDVFRKVAQFIAVGVALVTLVEENTRVFPFLLANQFFLEAVPTQAGVGTSCGRSGSCRLRWWTWQS
jgi:hypothetical protein